MLSIGSIETFLQRLDELHQSISFDFERGVNTLKIFIFLQTTFIDDVYSSYSCLTEDRLKVAALAGRLFDAVLNPLFSRRLITGSTEVDCLRAVSCTGGRVTL